jgi:molybdate transport system regulatory protein
MPFAPSRLTVPDVAATPVNRVVLRLDLACGARIGPGKVALLEAIERTGSISAAGRALRMSYRRAWELVEDLNRHCRTPVVAAAAGGSGGGGARLTEIGAAIVAQYRALEAEATDAAKARLAALEALCPSH